MSWSEFFSMGGYGFYVWGSYAVTLIALGGEVIFLLRRKKNLTSRPDLDRHHSSESDNYENQA